MVSSTGFQNPNGFRELSTRFTPTFRGFRDRWGRFEYETGRKCHKTQRSENRLGSRRRQRGRARLPDLADDWDRSLRTQRKAELTRLSHKKALELFTRYQEDHELPLEAAKVTRRDVKSWLDDLFQGGVAPSTVALRFAGLQQFFKSAEREEEVVESPMRKLRPPKVIAPSVPILHEDELKALLATCAPYREFRDRRDLAIMRLFIDTGLRLAELAGLQVDDVD